MIFTSGSDDLANFNGLAPEKDLALRNPRDIEQVLEQAIHLRNLSLDHRQRPLPLLARDA
jgi:hypothetical protein